MTEPTYLVAVRESYDTVAADYAKRVRAPAGLDPVSRAMLAAFAELVQATGRGPVVFRVTCRRPESRARQPR